MRIEAERKIPQFGGQYVGLYDYKVKLTQINKISRILSFYCNSNNKKWHKAEVLLFFLKVQANFKFHVKRATFR
jgi:hypothetical protein